MVFMLAARTLVFREQITRRKAVAAARCRSEEALHGLGQEHGDVSEEGPYSVFLHPSPFMDVASIELKP